MKRLASGLCLAMLALGGCGSNGTPAHPITVSGVVSDYQTMNGVAGMSACLFFPMLSPQPCATTAADGSFVLTGVPANTQVIGSLNGNGYFPILYPRVTGSTDATANLLVFKSGTITLLAAAVGQSVDTTKGQLAISVNNGGGGGDGGAASGTPGVTVSMSPQSGMGPFYFSAGGIPQPTSSQTTTTTSGAVAFVNVDPSDVELTFTGPTGVTCGAPLTGWPGSTANSVKARLAAGYGTATSITCR